jgi:hypothetical protein
LKLDFANGFGLKVAFSVTGKEFELAFKNVKKSKAFNDFLLINSGNDWYGPVKIIIYFTTYSM